MRFRTMLFAITVPLILAALSAIVPAQAGTGEALAYIRNHQTPDGGFCEPGRGSTGQDATTSWCIMALAAAGVDPSGLRPKGRSPLDFLATQSANWRSVTDYERTLLAVVAGGGNPYEFAGLDLVAKVRSCQRSGGNIGDAVNSNAFGMLAYKAAGIEIPPGAVDWHKMVQNRDGGWGNSPGAASNPDMTAASIMALRAAGVAPGDSSITAALSYLHSIQNADGGFAFQSTSSDVAATAWCVQALVAAGQDPAGPGWSKNGNTPWGFILSMQAPDGHFTWMQGRDVNPLWTTAYAVCSLSRKPYPVAVFQGSGDTSGQGTVMAPQEGGRENAAVETVGAGAETEETGVETGGEAFEEESGMAEECRSGDSGDREVGTEETPTKVKGEKGGVHPIAWALPMVVVVLLGSAAFWYFMVRGRASTGEGG
ncbi:MAG: prenyltransferase/squalene oxidase repeat-containing protein [Actinomycetota bacterium]